MLIFNYSCVFGKCNYNVRVIVKVSECVSVCVCVSVFVCVCVCVCVSLHDNSKRNQSRNTILEYIVYENSSDEFVLSFFGTRSRSL